MVPLSGQCFNLPSTLGHLSNSLVLVFLTMSIAAWLLFLDSSSVNHLETPQIYLATFCRDPDPHVVISWFSITLLILPHSSVITPSLLSSHTALYFTKLRNSFMLKQNMMGCSWSIVIVEYKYKVHFIFYNTGLGTKNVSCSPFVLQKKKLKQN